MFVLCELLNSYMEEIMFVLLIIDIIHFYFNVK